jgi:hypothetical protein
VFDLHRTQWILSWLVWRFLGMIPTSACRGAISNHELNEVELTVTVVTEAFGAYRGIALILGSQDISTDSARKKS